MLGKKKLNISWDIYIYTSYIYIYISLSLDQILSGNIRDLATLVSVTKHGLLEPGDLSWVYFFWGKLPTKPAMPGEGGSKLAPPIQPVFFLGSFLGVGCVYHINIHKLPTKLMVWLPGVL